MIKQTVSNEKMRILLKEITNELKSYIWVWVKDGWGYDMITTKKKKYIIDICINMEKENEALIYISKNNKMLILASNIKEIKETINENTLDCNFDNKIKNSKLIF